MEIFLVFHLEMDYLPLFLVTVVSEAFPVCASFGPDPEKTCEYAFQTK